MTDAQQQGSPLIEQLQRAQIRLAGVALVVMMLVTVADVFFRYTFNKPLRISYDLTEAMMAIFVFNGIAGVFFQRRNVAIDLIDTLVGASAVKWLVVLADTLSILSLGLLGWAMIGEAWQAFQYGDRKIELGIPIYVLWAFALAGLAGTIVCALAAALSPSVKNDRPPL